MSCVNISTDTNKLNKEGKCEIKEFPKLWILEFDITNNGKGCAVIKANNANNAIRILLAGGQYNGTPSSYKVTRVEEIIESPDEMLICEQIL